MTNPKISVIIPVYNAQKYLHECIESVLCQPMKDLEIICVDDGSTDNSPAILDEYARKYHQIKVIHQNNQHLGPARNNGMKIASGEYIHFLDSDDFLVENAYEAIYEEAKRMDADNIKFRVHIMDTVTGEYLYDTIYNLSKIPQEYFGKVLKFANYPEAFLLNGISYPPWNGLYKRSFIIKNKIEFDVMHTFEDHTFYYIVLLNAEKIVYSDNYVLTYRKNISTSLVSGCLNHFECLFEVYRLLDQKTRSCPSLLRYLILGIELKSIMYWYSLSMESGQNWMHIKSATQHFIDKIDLSELQRIFQTKLWDRYSLKNLSDIFLYSPEKLKVINDQIYILKGPYYTRHFPLRLVKKGCKIAIYGAGAFGKRTVSVMNEMKYGKPCIWVDKNFNRISVDGYKISNPSEIYSNNFDFIIIAIEDKEIIREVLEFLVNKGISYDKIIRRDAGSNTWICE